MNGKARAEKFEDSYLARKNINVMNVILNQVHVLEDDCQIKKIMD